MKKIAVAIVLMFSCTNVHRAEDILGPGSVCHYVDGGARCVAKGRVYYCVREYGCQAYEMSCGLVGAP